MRRKKGKTATPCKFERLHFQVILETINMTILRLFCECNTLAYHMISRKVSAVLSWLTRSSFVSLLEGKAGRGGQEIEWLRGGWTPSESACWGEYHGSYTNFQLLFLRKSIIELDCELLTLAGKIWDSSETQGKFFSP